MLLKSLEPFRDEVLEKLKAHPFAVFYSLGRLLDKLTIVHWDWESHPSVDGFLQVAHQLDVKVIQMHERRLTAERLDDIKTGLLPQSGLPSADLRDFSKRLQQCERYVGQLGLVELSFDFRDRVYLFTVETDWFADLDDVTDLLLSHNADSDDDDAEPSVGGFFSRN
jgi:hypothetical protein